MHNELYKGMSSVGVLLYSKDDVEKNEKFISIFREFFKGKDVDIRVETLEELNIDSANPLFVVNRSRSYKIAQKIEDMGIKVFNSADVTHICNDKWLTYLFAKKNGIEVLHTEKGDEANLEFPVVIKSCSGHGGNEVFLANDMKEYESAKENIDGEYITQPLADTKGKDTRVYVLGGNIIVAMQRQAKNGFKSNFSLGGEAKKVELSAKEISFVKNIINNLNMDYAGIDLIYDGERLVLNEIEDAVGARMVYANTDIDMIGMYAQYVYDKVYNI